MGPVLAVMPWNFPLWQAMRFAAPALMAGNVGLLKHASNVPQTALYLEDVLRRAGFPDDVFQTLLIGSADVERVLRDDRGRGRDPDRQHARPGAVAPSPGDVLKTTVLELGGSDPFVVMPSADLERAAQVAATARCQNNGQSCIAAKRFIVHATSPTASSSCSPRAVGAGRRATRRRTAPTSGRSRPSRAAPTCEELVQDAVARARPSSSAATRPDGPGWYYPPTLLTGVTPRMRMFREEVFGPVAQLHRVPDLDAALALANDTDFGLGSNAWTNDPRSRSASPRARRGHGLHQRDDASYPELPFGGIKASGYGPTVRAGGSASSATPGRGGSASDAATRTRAAE
jgi:succinate-semialdehyde dehydrogenase/glutarate-semialdehyde dehydrogenase